MKNIETPVNSEIISPGQLYWQEKLEGELPIMELPQDYRRPPVSPSSRNRDCESLPINPQLTERIKELVSREETSLFEIFLTAFNIFLHRYTGEENIIVGSVLTRTVQSGVMSVNPIALCTDLQGDPKVTELLGHVHQTVNEAAEHGDYPFQSVIAETAQNKASGGESIFQMMLVLCGTSTPLTECPLSGEEDLLEIQEYSGQCDLFVIVDDEKGTLKITFEYNADLFTGETIQRFLRNFNVLISGMVSDSCRRISRLPLLAEEERQLLLTKYNCTQADYPKDKCIHQLFEEQVKKEPDAVAVMFEGQELTYRELNRRANRLAHYLWKAGVKPEVLVGICLERSLEMIVGLMGILKAGGAYVPLDPAYPDERIEYILLNAEAKILVTSSKLSHTLPEHTAHVICMDTDWKAISEENGEDPDSEVKPDNLSYVIYTSGSTGKPKGVQICHQALVNFICSMKKEPGVKNSDRLLAVTTICFDIHTLEVYLPLTVGATIILVSRQTAADGFALASDMSEYNATVMQATPATWRMLLTADWRGHLDLKAICGGEALQRNLADSLLEKVGYLWNIYGPTETTVWSTIFEVKPDRIEKDGPESIGHPIANTQTYILDEELQPVPLGIAGELYIGGDGIARGYQNRPELTVERFVENPFANDFRSPRLYKTGDLARWRHDGNLEYLGRIDHQVKLRGFRIELGEIEAVLSRHEAVNEAVVVLYEQNENKFLAAYITEVVDAQAEIPSLQDWLGQSLPDYMVPTSFTVLDSLPLTPNGKTDRNALPAPEQIGRNQEQAYVGAKDPLEQQLVIIWEKTLNIKPIGVRDNFFDIGGNSLLAVGLFAEIGKKFGRQFPVPVLLKAPTVEKLAEVLKQDGWSPPRTALVPIQVGGDKPPFFYVPPGGCTALNGVPYARYLGKEQPVYGLQPLGFEEGETPHERIKDLAAYYVSEIRKFQPEGPYYFGGPCFGAYVAFEMACQLNMLDCKVGLVALLDPPDPPVPLLDRNIYEKVAYYLRKFHYYLKTGQLFPALMDFFFYNRYYRIQNRYFMLMNKIFRRDNRLENVLKAHVASMDSYIPQFYSGKITIFENSSAHALDKKGESYRAFKCWADFAEEVDSRVIQGRHLDIFKGAQFQQLVEQLKISLNEAQNIKKYNG